MNYYYKQVCEDVNRQCEFGEVIERKNISDEKVWVVDRTIGYDDIGHYEKTGKFIKTIDKVKIYKYCGNTILVDSETKIIDLMEL